MFVKDRFKERFFGRYSRRRSVWPVRFVILLVLVTKSGEKSTRESCFFSFCFGAEVKDGIWININC